jgi:D-sedoheptulose 7-phosphate isomerase
MNPRAFAIDYIETLCKVLRALPLDDLARAMRLLEDARDQGRRVYLAGNGGSAATASHMANDLLKGVSLAGRPGLQAICLSDCIPLMTANANDDGYETIFSTPLRTLARSGELLVVVTGSGRSPNILAALEVAKELDLRTLGFLGKGGGPAQAMVDVAVVVPSDDYGPIEDVHMVFDHLITAWLKLGGTAG